MNDLQTVFFKLYHECRKLGVTQPTVLFSQDELPLVLNGLFIEGANHYVSRPGQVAMFCGIEIRPRVEPTEIQRLEAEIRNQESCLARAKEYLEKIRGQT